LLLPANERWGITPQEERRKIGVSLIWQWIQRPFLHDLRVASLPKPKILLLRVCPESQFRSVRKSIDSRWNEPCVTILGPAEERVGVIEDEGLVDHWSFPGRFLRVWKMKPGMILKARKNKFDVVIIPMNNPWGESYFHCKIFALVCGAKFRELHLPKGAVRKLNTWIFLLRDIPWSFAYSTIGRIALAPLLFTSFAITRKLNRILKWIPPVEAKDEAHIGK
jgi:hypothetical protein